MCFGLVSAYMLVAITAAAPTNSTDSIGMNGPVLAGDEDADTGGQLMLDLIRLVLDLLEIELVWGLFPTY